MSFKLGNSFKDPLNLFDQHTSSLSKFKSMSDKPEGFIVQRDSSGCHLNQPLQKFSEASIQAQSLPHS